jgi:hypothetical protein
LRRLETSWTDAEVARDGCAIRGARGGRNPAIERIALRAHGERDTCLSAHRVDPCSEAIEDAAGLAVRDRGIHSGIDIRRDAELRVGRLPLSRAVHEHDAG